jgi:hypothetical protein
MTEYRRLRRFYNAVITEMKVGLLSSVKPLPEGKFRGILPAPTIPDKAWLERVAPGSPSLHVGIKGPDQVEYLNNGQLSGSITMVAHVVTTRTKTVSINDALLDAIDDTIAWLSLRSFDEENGVAVIQRWENLWSSDTDDGGYAFGTILWEQQVIHGLPSHVEPLL